MISVGYKSNLPLTHWVNFQAGTSAPFPRTFSTHPCISFSIFLAIIDKVLVSLCETSGHHLVVIGSWQHMTTFHPPHAYIPHTLMYTIFYLFPMIDKVLASLCAICGLHLGVIRSWQNVTPFRPPEGKWVSQLDSERSNIFPCLETTLSISQECFITNYVATMRYNKT